METFSALLAICAWNSPVPGEFPTQRPVTLSKQSWGWWFETPSCTLWRHRNVQRSSDTIAPCLAMIEISKYTITGPFYWHVLDLIPAWISNCTQYIMWGEITYPFPNFNGATVEVWEWISNFIPHFIIDVITSQYSRMGNYATVWMDSQRVTRHILYDFHISLTSSTRNSIIACIETRGSSHM